MDQDSKMDSEDKSKQQDQLEMKSQADESYQRGDLSSDNH